MSRQLHTVSCSQKPGKKNRGKKTGEKKPGKKPGKKNRGKKNPRLVVPVPWLCTLVVPVPWLCTPWDRHFGGACPLALHSLNSCSKIWQLVLISPPISAPFGAHCRACRWAWRQQPQHRLRCNVLRSSQSYLLRLIIIFIVISNQTLLAGTAAGQSDSDRGCRGAAGDSSPL